jgi:hypothetical protein
LRSLLFGCFEITTGAELGETSGGMTEEQEEWGDRMSLLIEE